MNETVETAKTLSFQDQKFFTLQPSFSVSFCLAYIGDNMDNAYRQLDRPPAWPDEMLYCSPSAVKIYQPACSTMASFLAEQDSNIIDLLLFSIQQEEEDFCEFAIRRETRNGKNPRIACFRERDHIRNEEGMLVEKEGTVFGFGLPHPWKKDFVSDPNYVRLVDHRPGTEEGWPGFEPVWLKVKDDESSPVRYFKLELVWLEVETKPAVGLVVCEMKESDGEIPQPLKNCDFAPIQ